MKNEHPDILLKPTAFEDLETLFQFQLDKEGGYLAAFMPEDPTDKAAYISKHARLLESPSVHKRTIMLNDTIVGCVDKFVIEGDAEITYWIDKKYWRQGIATKALQDFLLIESSRPIFGRVAFDNWGSQRVLEKAGFIRIGAERNFANARQTEIEEFIYQLS